MDFTQQQHQQQHQQLYQIDRQPEGFNTTEKVIDNSTYNPELVKYLNALNSYKNSYVFRYSFKKDFNSNFAFINKEVKDFFDDLVYQLQMQLIKDGYLCAYRYDEKEFYTNIKNKQLNILKILDPVDQWVVIEILLDSLKNNINNYMFANGLYIEEDSGVIDSFNKSPTYTEFFGELFIASSLLQSVNYINQVYKYNNEYKYTVLSLNDLEEDSCFVPKAMNQRAQLVISKYIEVIDDHYTEFKHSTLAERVQTIIFDQLQELVEIKEFKYNSIEEILKTDIGMLYTSLKYNECPQLEQSNLEQRNQNNQNNDLKNLDLSNLSKEDIKRFKSLCAHVKKQFVVKRILYYKPTKPSINPYNPYNPQYKNLDCTIKELLNLLEKDNTSGLEEGTWEESTSASGLNISGLEESTNEEEPWEEEPYTNEEEPYICEESTSTSGLDIASIWDKFWNTTNTNTTENTNENNDNNTKTYTINLKKERK